MKAKEIKDLISFIADSGLAEVGIETEEIKLKIKRDVATNIVSQEVIATPISTSSVAAPAAAPAGTTQAVAPQTNQKTAEEDQASTSASQEDSAESSANYVEVKSPMIGTFYRSPSPEADSFVNVGDTIKEGDVVCIIEAMKLFNEIESEVSGKIVKVLVDNASPVEYDQPLYLVDPS